LASTSIEIGIIDKIKAAHNAAAIFKIRPSVNLLVCCFIALYLPATYVFTLKFFEIVSPRSIRSNKQCGLIAEKDIDR